MYWKRRYGGKVIELNAKRIGEGHCTAINYRNYKRTPGPNVRNVADLDLNYSIDEVAERLGLSHLL